MTYFRTIRFADTDAAGVVYFASLMSVCHEAYEAAIAESGIDLRSFFSGSDVAVPIVRAEIDFFQPLFCGDAIEVRLAPNQLSSSEFEVIYDIFVRGCSRRASRATTRHVCIDPHKRRRQPLPEAIERWVSSSAQSLEPSPDEPRTSILDVQPTDPQENQPSE
ncbi:14-dihydroxy-2-naphthoyl-CoA hydrolase in phylloquinone biosynthesis [Geitlerinema sp. FC II]|uniref:thioesterase family protein n=1 Tax=Baaleninema simplex TaxID=2862350 RepID=UPI00034C4A4F|nr:14-dihydroxy-2-naphthoyl-CoA hydrolase in phylloquinone biosynthesis [Geitlerinema sp. FC II]